MRLRAGVDKIYKPLARLIKKKKKKKKKERKERGYK